MSHIFIFGPSCSGKSTLAQKLADTLNATYLDRDLIIEEGTPEVEADQDLDHKLQSLKDRVIVDAQVPWREKRACELFFLILPPLQTLIERDERRTVHLQRTPERALRARQYVISTHEALSQMSKTIFDHCFHSSTVEEEVRQVCRLIENKIY